MPNSSETLLSRIDERLSVLQKSRWWLSMEISDRKQHGIIKDIERKGTMPGADRLRKIAETLGTTTDYLLGTSANPEPVLSEVAIAESRLDYLAGEARRARSAEAAEQGIPLVGTGDCADLEVIDDDGHDVTIERSSFDADYQVRMIDRPPALRGARHAYAIYFQGSSMEPRFFAGEIGIVDPDRPAGPGDFVLVQLNNGEEDHVVSVLVKRLIRQTSAYVELEQFNPATIFKISKNKVARVHKIMPPTDLLFR